MTKKIITKVVLLVFTLVLVLGIKSNYSYALPESTDGYTKYELQPGLNIIAIDLGGPVNSNREKGSYGDATLIEQNGNYLLMDTGIDDKNNVLINFLKSQEINELSIYISHYHIDHYGKMSDILSDEYFTIDNIYIPNPDIVSSKIDAEDKWYNEINDFITNLEEYKSNVIESGVNVELMQKGSSIMIGEARLDVIWDINQCTLTLKDYYNDNNGVNVNNFVNDTSLVSMINYKGIKYLTAGDIEEKVEQKIVESGLDIKAEIFKFSHHGGVESNSDSFIDKVQPIYSYLPNNYTAGKNSIIWYGDRDNGKYSDLVENLCSRTNVLSTLYNGNILYNISPDGIITSDASRNYHTLTVNYVDKESGQEIETSSYYRFNDRSDFHIDKINAIKDIENYSFLNSTEIASNDISEDTIITCYYQKNEVTVDYSTKDITNQDVNVTITANNELRELDGWTISQDRKSLTKMYSENKTETIEVMYSSGKKYPVTIEIENIDKEKPIVEVKYSTTEPTSDDVIVTIEANEQLQEIENWKLSTNKQKLTKTYSKNAEETITITDLAGNSITTNIKITNIYKVSNAETDSDYDPTTANTIIPYAGEKAILIISSVFIIASIILFIKIKTNKDIK